MLKSFRILLGSSLVLLSLLPGCSTYKAGSIKEGPSLKQMEAGRLRIIALADENLNLDQIKDIYKEDFDQKSRYYNPDTKKIEYTVYPYGKKERPMFMGFDQKSYYVYTRDQSILDSQKRPKILWAKEANALFSAQTDKQYNKNHLKKKN